MKLLLVEDHALVRDGMSLTLRQLDDCVEVLEAGDGGSALGLIERHPNVDLVLLDLMLPDGNGLGFLHTLRASHPTLPVIVVSALDDANTVRSAIQAGANGFVPKSSQSDVLLDAIHAVLAGGLFVPDDDDPKAGPGGVSHMPGGSNDLGLSDAQMRVFKLLVQGLSNREIGLSLCLAEGTVKIHVSKIFRCLGVSSRPQAMVLATRLGLKL